MSIQKYFTQTITILKKNTNRDNVGQRINDFVSDSTVVGVINPLSGNDIYTCQKKNIIAEYACYLPGSTTITENNRISYNNIQYQIVFIDNPFLRSVFLKLYLKRVI